MRFAYLILPLYLLATGCDSATGDSTAPDISGSWMYSETVNMVFPGELAGDFFGVDSEGPQIHVDCLVRGTATVQQNGQTFSIVTTQGLAACVTQGGQPAAVPWPPDPSSGDGMIVGMSIDIAWAADAAGVACSKSGAVTTVSGGRATELQFTGGCDLSVMPFPATAVNSDVFTRQ